MPPPGHATQLLRRLGDGDAGAAEELASLLYDELHGLACRAMVRAEGAHTLQPTALVSEAWIKLVGGEAGAWDCRTHFLATAAKAMRSVLVDSARRRATVKRSGRIGERVELDAVVLVFEESATDLIALDESLVELAGVDPQLAQIVELRFFGGLNNPEVAEVLGVSTRTVERGWATARAWLYEQLVDPGSEAG